MAISRVSSASAQASSVSITTPLAGDLILVCAHRDGSNTAPSLPTGYVAVENGGSNTNSERVGYKFSDGTETTSSTWTNATSVAVGVYRGVDPSAPIGARAHTGGASTSVATSTLTMQAADGSSWVVAFGAHRTATDLNQNLSGLTLQSSATDVNISDSNGAVSSYTGGSITVNASSGWRTATLELCAKQSVALPSEYVQSWCTESNLNYEHGNGFVIPLPNPTGAGNTLAFGITHAYSAGRTLSFKDQNGSALAATLRQGPVQDAGNLVSSRFYTLENVSAGIKSITVTFDTSVYSFQSSGVELCGVAASAYDTGASSGDVLGPTLQPGSSTTTADGDIIVTYAIIDSWGTSMLGNTITGIRAGIGHRFLSADREVGIMLMVGKQAAAGAINPDMHVPATTDDAYNILSVSLKTSPGAGAQLSGCRVVNITHTRTNAGTAQKISAPTNGNCQVISSAFKDDQEKLNSVSASGGGTWSVINTAGYPQMAVAGNLADDPTNLLTLSVTEHGSGFLHTVIYDIAGADTSPYDGEAHTSGGSVSAGGTISAGSITPSRTGGVIVTTLNLYTGPPDLLTVTPDDGVFDSVYYTGETDLSPMDAGDGYGHVRVVTGGAQSFSWRDTEATSGWFWMAISILAPATVAAAPTPPRPIPPPSGFL